MTVSWQAVPVPLGVAGIETRVDPKMVPLPRLRRLENATFQTPGAIRKRHGSSLVAQAGYAAGVASPIATARWIAARDAELVLHDGYRLLTATPSSSQAWQQVAYFPGISATRSDIPASALFDMSVPDVAIAGGMIGYVMEANAAGTVTPYLVILDATTRAVLTTATLTGTERPRIIGLGDALLVFTATTASNAINVSIYTAAAAGGVVATASTVLVADLSSTTPIYDVVVSGAMGLIAWFSTTGTTMKFSYFTTDGVLAGTTATEAGASAPVALCLAVDGSNSHIAMAWASNAGTRLDAREYDATLAPVAATVQIDSTHSGYRNLTAVWYGSSGARVCDVYYELSAAATYNAIIYRGTITAGSGAVWKRHAGLAARAWRYGGDDQAHTYVPLTYDSTMQSTYFLYEGTGAIVGRLLGGSGGGLTSKVSHLGAVAALSTGVYLFAALEKQRLGEAGQGTSRALVEYALDMEFTPQVVVVDGVLLAPGAAVYQYDGLNAVENGFFLYPDNITWTTTATATGHLEGGKTYLYNFYFEWTSRGRRERSAGVDIAVTIPDGRNSVTFTIPTLTHTQRTNVAIVGYRTLADEVDIGHRISNPDYSVAAGTVNGYLGNVTTADTVTFTDELADDTIASREVDYESAGEVSNDAPPACRCIAAGNGRVFIGGLDDPNAVMISKLRGTQEAIAFSLEIDQIIAAAGEGPLTAIATLRDAVILFREHQIYTVVGPGPDNTGTSGAFEDARVLSYDLGCGNPRSLVPLPSGLVFESSKGFYLLANDSTLSYIGAPVEAYNPDVVTSAVALPAVHEIRFTLASGSTLLYDYLADAWALWTVGGLAATSWLDQWTFLAGATGATYKEDASTFLDDGVPYSLIVETAWIRTGDLQGAQKVRRAMFLGEYRAGHRPQVRFAYDYQEFWWGPFTWDSSVVAAEVFGAGTPYGTEPAGIAPVFGGQPVGYQFEARTPKERCQAIRIQIKDVSDGTTLGDSFRLSGLALEAGVRKPLAKLAVQAKAQ